MVYDRSFGYNFTFTFGKTEYGFSKISGLETSLELETIPEGGLNGWVHTVPAPQKQPKKLVLEVGVGPSSGLDHLCVGRRLPGTCSIIVYKNAAIQTADTQRIARKYDLHSPMITACKTGTLDARSNTVLIDTLEMVYQRLTQVK